MILPDNLIPKYLFVNFFEWTSTYDREKYQGKPEPGRVYRSLYNPTTKSYTIILTPDSGILVPKLINEDVEMQCLSTISEITLTNILDFNIQEEDLDNLNTWMETNNQDLRPQPVQGLVALRQAMNNQHLEELDAMDRASKTLGNLWITNSLQFEIVLDFIEALVADNLSDDPAKHLTLHPKNGLGVNLARALRSIDIYSSDNRRINEDVEDLIDAMVALTVEQERKIINDQTD